MPVHNQSLKREVLLSFKESILENMAESLQAQLENAIKSIEGRKHTKETVIVCCDSYEEGLRFGELHAEIGPSASKGPVRKDKRKAKELLSESKAFDGNMSKSKSPE